MVSLFDTIIKNVINLEGGFVDDPKDPGGKTKYGISQKTFPNLKIESLSKEQAANIYKEHFWDPYPFYKEIKSPQLIMKLFVAAINMGQKRANICMQRAARSFKYLDPDGIIGPKSLETINAIHANELIPAFNSECACRYRMLCQKNPSLKKFLNGWLNRAYMKFPQINL